MPRSTAFRIALTLTLALLAATPDHSIAAAEAAVADTAAAGDAAHPAGTLALEPGVFVARSHATLRLVYTAGSRILEPGGALRVDAPPTTGYGAWQTVDPGADDYLTIDSSNPELVFEAAPDGHGALLFRLRSGVMEPGDRITLTYGDTRDGSRGARMPETATDRLELPLAIAFTADEPFRPLEAPAGNVRVSGAHVAAVRALAPSVVRPAETFTLSVRAEDRFRNPAATPLPGWRVTLGDRVIAEIPEGSSPLSLLPEIRIRQTGVHVFGIESSDGTIRGVSNPILVDRNPPGRIFWGDMNAHTGPGTATHSATRFLDWARADARLDFVGLNDPAGIDRLPARYRSPGFTPLPGQSSGVVSSRGIEQISFAAPGAAADRIPPLLLTSFRDTPGDAGPEVAPVNGALANIPFSNGAFVDEASTDAGPVTAIVPDAAPELLELSSRQGNFEWAFRQGLDQGYALAAVGGSGVPMPLLGHSAADQRAASHRRGLTAIIVPYAAVGSGSPGGETADARARRLFEALRAGSTYATNGARMIVNFSLNGATAGTSATATDTRRIDARVIGTAALDTISLVRNGQVIRQRDLLTDTASRPGTDGRYLLSFDSDSAPGVPQSGPRGWRNWQGRVRVEGATLTRASGYDDQNPLGQRWTPDAEEPPQIEFATHTRGGASLLQLTLQDVQPGARLVLELDGPATAAGAAPAGTVIELPLAALHLGRLTRTIPQDGFSDRIELRKVKPQTARDAHVRWNDSGAGPNDYYYLRATQIDGGTAWSSPIRVGAPRPPPAPAGS